MLKQKEVPTNIIDKDIRIAELEAELKKVKSRKKYGLVWEDHAEELDNKNVIPLLDLREDLSLPKINGMPDNYLIEGDNYHALKALQHTHKGLVDVIYIDPPYNTGNQDFTYNDKMVDIEDGFRHSKWLSFMEKRLILARNLMTDTGVVFVSIDDNEQANLRLLMDSVFGENNVDMMVWNKEYEGAGRIGNIKRFRGVHEYILLGYSNKKDVVFDKVSTPLENDDGRLDTANILMTQGKEVKGHKNEYSVKSPLGEIINKHWKIDINEFRRLEKLDLIYWGKDNDRIPRKILPKDHRRMVFMESILNKSSNSIALREYENVMGDSILFSYPKPVGLLRTIFSAIPNKNAIFLDFFSGSGTTAQSVLELNKEDGGNRSFIMCTNNEVSEENERNYLHVQGRIAKNNKTEYNKYRKDNPIDYQAFLDSKEYQELGIARAVTRERIKSVIEGYTTPKGVDVEGIPNNLTYLQTHEFDKIDIDGRNRKRLVSLALNSHKIKYSEDKYETVVVDALFDIEDYVIKDKSKELVFFLDFRDTSSINEITTDIYEKFCKHVLTERFENYYDAERGR